MCFRNFEPYDSEGPYLPLPRPIPRLAWAVPVDILELGVSIEAYSKTVAGTNLIRLHHRFRPGPLSQIPQEILELIIDETRRLEKVELQPQWEREFKCFQGRCSEKDHFAPYGPHTELAWNDFFVEFYGEDGEYPLDPANYSNLEKVEMVQDAIGNDDYADFGSEDVHQGNVRDWLDRVCLCSSTKASGGFRGLNELLNSHFGLEAVVFHEILPFEITRFHPDMHAYAESPYYTCCYLAASRSASDKHIAGGRNASQRNDVFASDGDHLSFCQVLDPSALKLSDGQKHCFAKALRVLDVSPQFHLSELQPLISPPIADSSLLEICACPVQSCPSLNNMSSEAKSTKMREYLERKRLEIAAQPWPQFMCLSASEVVSPTGWPRW